MVDQKLVGPKHWSSDRDNYSKCWKIEEKKLKAIRSDLFFIWSGIEVNWNRKNPKKENRNRKRKKRQSFFLLKNQLVLNGMVSQ